MVVSIGVTQRYGAEQAPGRGHAQRLERSDRFPHGAATDGKARRQRFTGMKPALPERAADSLHQRLARLHAGACGTSASMQRTEPPPTCSISGTGATMTVSTEPERRAYCTGLKAARALEDITSSE